MSLPTAKHRTTTTQRTRALHDLPTVFWHRHDHHGPPGLAVQLVRIQLRVSEYGWTTQKVFHFLNFLVNGVRCFVFVFRRDVQKLQPEIVQHILLDMPSLAFFSTNVLLSLFWDDIYYQAHAVSTDGLRPSFYTTNVMVYV